MVGSAFLSNQHLQSNGGNHTGILVQAFVAEDLILATQTDENGRYVLPASPFLAYTLRFVRQGYTSTTLDVVWKEECGRALCFEPLIQPDTPLEDFEEVILQAKPARLSGLIALTPFSSPTRLQNTEVSIFSEEDMQDHIALTNPSADGTFYFNSLQAGTYTLKVVSPGYVSKQLTFTLQPGESYNIGQLSLAHQSTTNQSVIFNGQVLLSNAHDYAGTEVRILISETNQLITTVQTDSNGRFSALLAPDEAYIIALNRPNYQIHRLHFSQFLSLLKPSIL